MLHKKQILECIESLVDDIYKVDEDRTKMGRKPIVYDIIKGILECDTYELLIWIEWYFNSKRPSCRQCVETRKLCSKIPPNCLECGIPNIQLIKKNFKNYDIRGIYNEIKFK